MSLLPSRSFVEAMEAKRVADEKYHKEVYEPAQKKLEARKKEILDSLRIRYPELFAIKIDASSPAAKLILHYGFDVTSDTNLIGVLLRPHVQAIAKYGSGSGSHLNAMIADVIDKLDFDQSQVQQHFYGPYSTARSWDDKCDAGLHCALFYLHKISNNYLHSPTRTQIATEKQAAKQAQLNANKRSANAETARKIHRNAVLEQHGVKIGKPQINPYRILPAHIPMLEAKAEQETRNREYARIMTKVRKSAPPEADLLGLHTKPEEDLLVMPTRAEELASIFSSSSAPAPAGSSSSAGATSNSSTGKHRFYYPKVPIASSSAAALGGGGSMRRRKRSQRRRRTTRRQH